MLDSKDSTVTYTTISSPYEGRSGDVSPGEDGPPVMPEDPYAYVVAVFQALPSPDYVPGPEEPEQALPSLVYIPYVPEPVYPEYIPLEDDVFPAEEQPLPATATPTTDSPGYILESDLDEDPEDDDDEDPKEDPADYLADHDDDEEEEHPASADSIPPPPALRVTAKISSRPHPPTLFFTKEDAERPIKGRRADYGFVGSVEAEIRRRIKCSWSSKSQELEAVRILWCVDNYIYYNTVDFAGREEISTQKKCSWSSKSQELEAVRILWCVDNYIYYNTVDFAGREEISTQKLKIKTRIKLVKQRWKLDVLLGEYAKCLMLLVKDLMLSRQVDVVD
nr:hypothetical protein [Tanacetum cinerariifolium]